VQYTKGEHIPIVPGNMQDRPSDFSGPGKISVTSPRIFRTIMMKEQTRNITTNDTAVATIKDTSCLKQLSLRSSGKIFENFADKISEKDVKRR
jgi:hypothetical protein